MTPDALDQFRDPLGEALHQLRIGGVFYCHSVLSEPWGAHLPAMPGCVLLHLVTRGRCRLTTVHDEAGGYWLHAGDFALVPHGLGHRLQSDPGSSAPDLFELPRESVSDRFEILRSGGGGEATTMVCAAVRLEHPVAPQLLSSLPAVIRIEGAGLAADDWLPALLRLMAYEARQMRAGSEAVITRLADILVIQAIRHWVEHHAGEESGWLAALKDRRIGRALALIHRDPSTDWTVASLAHASSMSRSACAQRFTTLVGVPVIEYLRNWRMNLARECLSQGLNVAEAAARSGYRSDVAFARAFKRVQGFTPGSSRARTNRAKR